MAKPMGWEKASLSADRLDWLMVVWKEIKMALCLVGLVVSSLVCLWAAWLENKSAVMVAHSIVVVLVSGMAKMMGREIGRREWCWVDASAG